MRVPHVARAVAISLTVALTPGVADAATAKGNVKRPAGGVKLTTKTKKKVGSLVCGRVQGVWLPGSTQKGGWFVTYQQQSVTAAKAARKAKGTKRKALKRSSATLARKASTQYTWCAPLNGAPQGTRPGTGSATPASSYQPPYAAPYDPYAYGQQTSMIPVRVDVSGAAGLALRNTAPSGRSALRQASAGGSSNLSVVGKDGHVRDALVSGTATVSKFLIAPDGSVYVLFQYPVMLDVNDPSGSACLLARVVPGSTVPVCVDRTLSGVQWDDHTTRNPAIQFDATGAMYYLGYASTGGTVLRRYSNGTTSNLISDNVYVFDFLVLPDGRVLLSGSTLSTQAQWLRQLSPDGALSSLRASQSSFMRRFPDGNVYIGVSDEKLRGVLRYSSATSEIEPSAWIADSSWGGPIAHNDVSGPCMQDWNRLSSLCNGSGAYVQRVFEMQNDQVYALVGWSPSMLLARYFPSLSVPDTDIRRATAGASNGRDIVLSGLDAQDRNVLGTHDTATGEDRRLIGPEREIEMYHLEFTADGTKILFDGLRFADNTYILGQVDLATGDITAAAPTGGKLLGLQAFR